MRMDFENVKSYTLETMSFKKFLQANKEASVAAIK